ncbi:hypothetical protein FGRMN_8089 [Fusarium graminum]|nr:hypothetical protein FGRMN_8089 [Fusarium graminum]
MAMTDEAKNGSNETPARQRKAHKKSRLGCKSCKLRSVKCDESKPSCKRCAASGFICSFTQSFPSTLQLEHRSAGPVFSVADRTLGPINPGFRVPIVQPLKGAMGEIVLDNAGLAAVERFRIRTVLSLGTERTRNVYSQGTFMLAFKHPFLLHAFVALALLHDQHLVAHQSPSQRTALAFHWYQATALFHRRLATASSISDPSTLPGSERDSLWASGALLGAASFALLGVEDIETVWPLKESDNFDLNWLRMSDGKKVVWKLADPTRNGSIFQPLLSERDNMPDGNLPILPGTLPDIFYPMFDLGPSSTAENNPYHIAVSLLAQLLPHKIDDNTIIHFLTFLSQLDPRYRQLLEEKDAKAMVLLAWWYTKAAAHSSWWMQRRSLIEGQAICIYLERYSMHVEGIQELVQFPKRIFESCRENGGTMTARDKQALTSGMQIYQ